MYSYALISLTRISIYVGKTPNSTATILKFTKRGQAKNIVQLYIDMLYFTSFLIKISIPLKNCENGVKKKIAQALYMVEMTTFSKGLT